jgi:hypothetical protein
MMKKFFSLLSRAGKVTYSTNLEALETQHPNEIIKVVGYKFLETDSEIRSPISKIQDRENLATPLLKVCIRPWLGGSA